MHSLYDDIKDKFEKLNINFVSTIGPENAYLRYEQNYPNSEPVAFYGECGQTYNDINGQFEVESIDIIDYENTGNFYQDIVCDIFKTNYPGYEVLDAYGTLWDLQNEIKILNVYGDECKMEDRVGFYDLCITPVTLLYTGKDGKVFVESADLIYDYFDNEYRWINHIRFTINPKLGSMLKELGLGKRAYFRKKNEFIFRVSDSSQFAKLGMETHYSFSVIIPVPEV